MKLLKTSLSFLLTIALLISAFSFNVFASETATATSGTCGENATWLIDENGTLIISGEGEMDNFTFDDSAPWYSYPNNFNSVVINQGITSVGNYAFFLCSEVSSITLSDTVVTIGDYAFSHCSMPSITLPSSVTHIGSHVFYNCYELSSINFGTSITHIGEWAFAWCYKLISITIPDTVTHMGDKVFYDCNNLVSVTIGNSITHIGEETFSYCRSLSSVKIPSSVTSIGSYAFNNCFQLPSITIPSSVTSIGNDAFSGCASITEIIIEENNQAYSSLDGVLFNKDKTELIRYPSGKTNESYKIPNSVTIIKNNSFVGNDFLYSIVIPDSVTSIESYAFASCDSLTSITIPDSVTSIGGNAFFNCRNILFVTILNPEVTINYNAFGYIPYENEFGVLKIDALVIEGIKGSSAEAYAKENGFEFVEISSIPDKNNNLYMDTVSNTMPNVVAETTADRIISTLAKYNLSATITDINGNTLESDALVGTGCKVVTADDEFTVIVKGDVDGSGMIDSADYLKIKGVFVGKTILTNEFSVAADADGNGELSSTDYLKIKGYFLGNYDLYS